MRPTLPTAKNVQAKASNSAATPTNVKTTKSTESWSQWGKRKLNDVKTLFGGRKPYKRYRPTTQEELNKLNTETITQPGKATSTAVANVNIPDSSANIEKLAKSTALVDLDGKPAVENKIDISVPTGTLGVNRKATSDEVNAAFLSKIGSNAEKPTIDKAGAPKSTTQAETITHPGKATSTVQTPNNSTLLGAKQKPQPVPTPTPFPQESSEGAESGTTWKDTFKSAADTVNGYIPQKFKDAASVAYNKLPSRDQIIDGVVGKGKSAVKSAYDSAESAVKDLTKFTSKEGAKQYASEHPYATAGVGATLGAGIVAGAVVYDAKKAAKSPAQPGFFGDSSDSGYDDYSTGEELPVNVKNLVDYLNKLPKIYICGKKLPDLTKIADEEDLIKLKKAIFDAGENINTNDFSIVDGAKFINADTVSTEDLKMLERLHFFLWFSTPKCLVDAVFDGNVGEDGVPELGDGDNYLYKLGIAKVAARVTKENGTEKYIISESVWDYTDDQIRPHLDIVACELSQDNIEKILALRDKYNLKVEDFIKKADDEAAPPEGEKEENANNDEVFDINSADMTDEENVNDNISGDGKAISEISAQNIAAIAKAELGKQKEKKKAVLAAAPVQPAAPAPAPAAEGGGGEAAPAPAQPEAEELVTSQELTNFVDWAKTRVLPNDLTYNNTTENKDTLTEEWKDFLIKFAKANKIETNKSVTEPLCFVKNDDGGKIEFHDKRTIPSKGKNIPTSNKGKTYNWLVHYFANYYINTKHIDQPEKNA